MNKLYILSSIFFMIGSSYICILLYRWFCMINTANTSNIIENIQISIQHMQQIQNIEEKWIRCSYLTKGNISQIKARPLVIDTIAKINEPLLSFYQISNNSSTTLLFNSHISVLPSELEDVLTKIQCFCFQEQSIAKDEVLELPIFFFFENTNYKYSQICKHIIIHLTIYVKYHI